MLFIPCKSLYPCFRKKDMRMQGWLFKGTGVLTAKALFNPQFPNRGGLLEKGGTGGIFSQLPWRQNIDRMKDVMECFIIILLHFEFT